MTSNHTSCASKNDKSFNNKIPSSKLNFCQREFCMERLPQKQISGLASLIVRAVI